MTPWLCERFGRKIALGFFFSMMFVFIAFAFGRVFYFQTNALAWFMGCLFFLGIGGANFSFSSLLCPPQHRPQYRGPAFFFSPNINRPAPPRIDCPPCLCRWPLPRTYI